MTRLSAALALGLLVPVAGYAGPPTPPATPTPIRFPAIPAPKVDPVIPPGPGAVTALGPGLLYVIDADVEILVACSPRELVTMSTFAGPAKVYGRFADGTGKSEFREYKGKKIVAIEAAGTGRVDVIIVPAGAKSEEEIVWRALQVDNGTKPKPVDPVVPPAPKPDGKFGLSKASRDGAAGVTSPAKADEAAALASGNRGLASAIAAGGVEFTPGKILDAWREANRTALDKGGEDLAASVAARAAWKPWADTTSAGLSAAYNAGKLATKQDWVDAFNAIADGLKE